MNLEEILRLEEMNRAGMSPEEIQRRRALIERVAQHTPELAMTMAQGPYRMNGGQGVGDSMTAQQAWSRNPGAPAAGQPNPAGTAYQRVPPQEGPGGMPPSAIPGAPPGAGYQRVVPDGPTPSTTGPVVPAAGPPDMSGPRYDFPAPSVSIHVSGTQPSAHQYGSSVAYQNAPFPMQPDPNFRFPQFDMSLHPQAHAAPAQSGPPGGYVNGMATPPPYNQSEQYWGERYSQQLGTAFGPQEQMPDYRNQGMLPRAFPAGNPGQHVRFNPNFGPQPLSPQLATEWSSGGPPGMAGNAMWQGQRMVAGMMPQGPVGPRPVNIQMADGSQGTYNQNTGNWHYTQQPPMGNLSR